MSKRDTSHLHLQIEVAENGYVLITGRGNYANGFPADRYVFNDIADMNEFIFELTGELE